MPSKKLIQTKTKTFPKIPSKKKGKKKKKLEDDWEINEGSDHPVHEKYTKEEPVKK